jgi:hypothetical protein
VTLSASYAPRPAGPETLVELKPGSTYHHALVATNQFGIQAVGEDHTFTTLPATPPIVDSESSQGVTQSTATITVTLDPNGLQTSYILEVGTEVEGKVLYSATAFGQVNKSDEPLSFSLTGLQPGTAYHWRLAATNQDGTAYGADQSFTTAGFASALVQPSAVALLPFTSIAELDAKEAEENKPAKPLTNAQKLSKALEACKKDKKKRKRATCEKQAHHKYGAVMRKSMKKH